MVRVKAPLETVPLYVRGGAIIPMGPEMDYVGEKATDPLTLDIYPDAQGNASTSLYEDDGVSPAYRNGVERRTTVTYRSSEIDVSAPTGSIGSQVAIEANPALGRVLVVDAEEFVRVEIPKKHRCLT